MTVHRLDDRPDGQQENLPVIVITGPTASGKGTLAFELARAIGAEIISIDSMKIYREMDIGTAKPSPERRAEVDYHLIDLLDPSTPFSTGEYLPILFRTIEAVRLNRHRVVIAGGTALYLKAFLDGFQPGPKADWTRRQKLLEETRLSGSESLHERLMRMDPGAAAKIHPRDIRRIVRSLEVVELTGRPISSEWSWKPTFSRPDNVRVFGLEWPRDKLHERINHRVERMVAQGLFEEADRLKTRAPPLCHTASQSIGYKEIWQGTESGRSRREIIQTLQQSTRRFAKSQLTWFRKMPVEWIPMMESSTPEAAAGEVLRLLEGSP